MLTVLVSAISNSLVFLISVYAIFNDQSFNDTLTNNIVSFEQLGPGTKGMGHLVSDKIFLSFAHRSL